MNNRLLAVFKMLSAIGMTCCWVLVSLSAKAAALPETIKAVTPSVVAIATFDRLRSPALMVRGTGFVVGDGSIVATNAHVLPETLEANEVILALIPKGGNTEQRELRVLAKDTVHDLAVLKISGVPLPALRIRTNGFLEPGNNIAFTGFPIGGVLGVAHATHRGIVSAITPVVLPGGNARQLNEKSIRRLRDGSFAVYQLDATAYPGSSGSPLYDAETGEVVGVINMVSIKETKESVLSKPSGITFAVPASYLLELLGTVR